MKAAAKAKHLPRHRGELRTVGWRLMAIRETPIDGLSPGCGQRLAPQDAGSAMPARRSIGHSRREATVARHRVRKHVVDGAAREADQLGLGTRQVRSSNSKGTPRQGSDNPAEHVQRPRVHRSRSLGAALRGNVGQIDRADPVLRNDQTVSAGSDRRHRAGRQEQEAARSLARLGPARGKVHPEAQWHQTVRGQAGQSASDCALSVLHPAVGVHTDRDDVAK